MTSSYCYGVLTLMPEEFQLPQELRVIVSGLYNDSINMDVSRRPFMTEIKLLGKYQRVPVFDYIRYCISHKVAAPKRGRDVFKLMYSMFEEIRNGLTTDKMTRDLRLCNVDISLWSVDYHLQYSGRVYNWLRKHRPVVAVHFDEIYHLVLALWYRIRYPPRIIIGWDHW